MSRKRRPFKFEFNPTKYFLRIFSKIFWIEIAASHVRYFTIKHKNIHTKIQNAVVNNFKSVSSCKWYFFHLYNFKWNFISTCEFSPLWILQMNRKPYKWKFQISINHIKADWKIIVRVKKYRNVSASFVSDIDWLYYCTLLLFARRLCCFFIGALFLEFEANHECTFSVVLGHKSFLILCTCTCPV